jgi:hypothetical protein
MVSEAIWFFIIGMWYVNTVSGLINISTCAPRILPREVNNQAAIELYKQNLAILEKITDGGFCDHFYFDLGTNIGNSIRKLYEPEKFAGAPLVDVFRRMYGSNVTRVCSVGFEPNWQHVDRLKALQKSYLEAGFPSIIFTFAALSDIPGTITFYNLDAYLGTGSSINGEGGGGKEPQEAISVDTDDFIRKVMHLWKHSKSYVPGHSKVFAKMDIEGSEYFVLPKMIAGRSLCHIDAMTIEWHPNNIKCSPGTAVSSGAIEWLVPSICPNFQLSVLDDETFGLATNIPLPSKKTPVFKNIIDLAH